MGQGCNSSTSGWFQKLTPDTGIRYTGPAIPKLGICKGDLLSEVEGVILQAISNISSGNGITLLNPDGTPKVDLTTGACAILFADCLGCCNTCSDLVCLLNCFHNAICTLYDDVVVLQTQMATLQGPYNIGCLNPSIVGSNSNIKQILNELISEFCNLLSAFNVLNSSVGGFTAGINTTIGNFLTAALTSCQGTNVLNRTGTGATTNFSLRGFAPIGSIMPFAGPLGGPLIGRFDSTGLGLANTDCCGWALCNGNNGTVNMMGQVPVGLSNMGGSLPTNAIGLSGFFTSVRIDPTIPGEAKHLLSALESGSPGGGCTVTDLGHDHVFWFRNNRGNFTIGGANNFMDATGSIPDNTRSVAPPAIPPSFSAIAAKVGIGYSNITVNTPTSPAVNAHNNMQPSTGVYYIQRIS